MLHQLNDQVLPICRIMRASRNHRGGLGPCAVGMSTLVPYSIRIRNIVGGLFIYLYPLVNIFTYRGSPFTMNRVSPSNHTTRRWFNFPIAINMSITTKIQHYYNHRSGLSHNISINHTFITLSFGFLVHWCHSFHYIYHNYFLYISTYVKIYIIYQKNYTFHCLSKVSL